MSFLRATATDQNEELRGAKQVHFLIDLLQRQKTARKHKLDTLSQVIGICEGPPDLAEEHDSYADFGK